MKKGICNVLAMTETEQSFDMQAMNIVKNTGWLKEGNEWYYLQSNGVMQTGFTSVDGTTHYLILVVLGFLKIILLLHLM